jgi:hypothetical protein
MPFMTAWNYDSAGVVIRVDPVEIYDRAVGSPLRLQNQHLLGKSTSHDILSTAEFITTAVDEVHKIWEGLNLGWAGRTASEAQDFAHRWNLALERMFGSKEDSYKGALPRIAVAVAMAGMNFGSAEHSIHSMFTALTNSFDEPPGPATPPVRDHKEGPVTEVADAPPWR